MSNKRSKPASRQSRAPDGTQRLVVVGVRRKEPDWDTYIAALLSCALRKVEEEDKRTAADNGEGP